jgi:hypothetical protein
MIKFSGIALCGLMAAVIPHAALAATVDCPPSRVIYVQVETNAVLALLEGQGWHLIGMHSAAGTPSMYAGLLAAQMADKQVVLRYPAGFDCTAYELGTPAMMVRTVN